jgi:ornithine cyclodeaminase/alanine dehydrogenase-like protein (mu-crystallin family)
MVMLRVYSSEDVHAALPWPRLADALARAFAEGAEVPVRHAHALGGGDTLLLMPAWTAHSLGTKIVTVMPGNAARGVGTVQALYLLFDRSTGEPRALLDGEALTVRRTAAASALAARYLARDDARTLLVVGAGRLAPWMARAHVALRPAIDRVLLWARDPAVRETRAAELRREGLPAHAVGDLEAAVREADIVSCATTSTTPLVQGAWLRPGTHLDLVGGFRPDMREVDDDAVARSRVVADTLAGALAEAGDLLQPLQRGVIAREHVLGELADLARGTLRGRDSSDDVTLFKSVGAALEDLAAAELVVG